ncbi:MAG: LytR C-terminal domain-containing protein [Bacteroidetes bacterium]|nr:LytR C-terminal domain-containing protein [Bacteroidota bacterium]
MKRNRGKPRFSVGVKKYFTIAVQVLVFLFAAVLLYSLIEHLLVHPPVLTERADLKAPTRIEQQIQISVRNECGADGVAMDFTNYLRERGFDVVETTNGSIFNRAVTTVVDAAGNLQNAMRVAEALGVSKKNVITKPDPHAYVDVEVLIGEDYHKLKPRENIE